MPAFIGSVRCGSSALHAAAFSTTGPNLSTQNVTIFAANSILIGPRDSVTGVVGDLRDVGTSTAFKVAMTADKKELKDAKGQLIQSIQLLPSATVSIDLREMVPENFCLAMNGNIVPIAAAQAQTTTIASAKVGTYMLLEGVNVSNVSLTSNSTPLVEGTDYTLTATSGKVQFLTAQTGPVTATYDVPEQNSFSVMTDIGGEYFVRIEAVDLANNLPVVLELYRVRFSPAKELDLIGTDFATLSIDGDILIDSTKPADSVYGQYGRYRSLT